MSRERVRVRTFRSWLPLLIAAGAGLVTLADFFLAPAEPIGAVLVDVVTVIVAFGLLLGVLNLAVHHLGRVRQRAANWQYSIALVAAMLGVVILGLWPGSAGPNDEVVRWLFDYVYTPASATVFALLAFYVVTAAYRALRLRRIDSAFLALGALIVLLGGMPAPDAYSIPLRAARDWFLEYPVVAGVRGLALGVAIGVIGASFRVLAGIDRPLAE
ncbi:MAG: hypothetical protein HYY04_04230 [Chloroflexi bacterium]|nr:hypothetical protein [Chloroflexota bacterium]